MKKLVSRIVDILPIPIYSGQWYEVSSAQPLKLWNTHLAKCGNKPFTDKTKRAEVFRFEKDLIKI